jgi:hypothetical protein
MNESNNKATIVYCSSNREKPYFEKRIVESLLKNCGGTEIISVTQKPMELGTNICVGEDVGVSGYNFFRQVLIGCEAAKTQFIISAEADCLYPPDYFQWLPPRDDKCYRNTNLYVMGNKRDFFFEKKEGATHAQVIGREYYIETLKRLFKDAPMWSPDEKNFPKERHKVEDVVEEVEYYQTENPIVQIKTGDSMRHYTHSERVPIYEIPYWGKGTEVAKIKYE